MAGQRAKIVIVDDELSFINIFTKAMEMAGFEVKGFINPREAIVKIPEEKPQLILLDVAMPEINGFEVFERIKKDFKEGETPKIVFLTNLGETISGASIDEQYAKDIGAFGYLRKTDDLNNIIDKIKEIINRNR